MLKKVTALFFTLLLAIPAFASGHQLEAVGELINFFIYVIGGFLLVTLLITIISYYTRFKLLQAISRLLTVISLIICIYVLTELPSVYTILPVAIPAFCSYLLWKRNQKSDPVTVSYVQNYFLKMAVLYIIIQTAIICITLIIYRGINIHFIRFYISLIQGLELAINISVISWATMKLLLNDIAASKNVTILNGIAYSISLSIVATIITWLITYTGLLGGRVGRLDGHFWLFLGTGLLYTALAGCIGYLFASRKRINMITDEADTENQNLE